MDISKSRAPLLQVNGISVNYGGIEAVREVSLTVGRGEFVSIIGSNGAGKSTTLKAVAGVAKIASGEIVFDGTPIQGQPAHKIVRDGIAMVPEGRQVFADQTVEDNLMLGAYVRNGRGESAAVKSDIARMHEMFPILGQRHRQMAGSLSGGEQQMLAIARALLSKPRLLMIDEMSLGLAPKVLETLFPVLADLNRNGLAILLVEQLATKALSHAQRGYVMERSRILMSGMSKDLMKDPRVIEAYLGSRSERDG